MYKTLLYETSTSKFIEKQLSWPIWGLNGSLLDAI